jgi:hypothetical protein
MARFFSDLITDINAGRLPNSAQSGRGGIYTVEVKISVLAAHVDLDDYLVCKVPSNAIPVHIGINNSAITGGSDFDLGVTNGVTTSPTFDKDVLFDGLSMATAANNRVVVGAHLAADVGKTFWQLAGFSADPGGDLFVYLTGNTIGSADGAIGLTISYNAA